MSRTSAILGVLLLTACKSPTAVQTRVPAQPETAASQAVDPPTAEAPAVVHPPKLDGVYEITRIEYLLEGVDDFPAEFAVREPGYLFVREAFVFGATTIRHRFEIVTAPVGEAADSVSGACMVEAEASVRWLEQGLEVEVPAAAHASAQTIERTEAPTEEAEVFRSKVWTSSVTCSAHLTKGEYRLVEVSDDTVSGRPRAVTLGFGEELRYHLIAVDEKVDLRPVINAYFGRQ